MVSQIRLSGILEQSTVNGTGLRKVFFSQGCSHHCVNCFSPHTWPFVGGKIFNIRQLVKQVAEESYLSGVTFSGGDPFQQSPAFAQLAILLKKHNINIWAYTGYVFEELLNLAKKDTNIQQMLHNIDVIVDGRYVDSLHDSTLKYRGSMNQRIIDVAKSLKVNKTILMNI